MGPKAFFSLTEKICVARMETNGTISSNTDGCITGTVVDTAESDSKDLQRSNHKGLNVDISAEIKELQQVWLSPLRGENSALVRKRNMERTETSYSPDKQVKLNVCGNSSDAALPKELYRNSIRKEKISQAIGEHSSLLIESKLSCLSREALTELILEIIAEYPDSQKVVHQRYLDSMAHHSAAP